MARPFVIGSSSRAAAPLLALAGPSRVRPTLPPTVVAHVFSLVRPYIADANTSPLHRPIPLSTDSTLRLSRIKGKGRALTSLRSTSNAVAHAEEVFPDDSHHNPLPHHLTPRLHSPIQPDQPIPYWAALPPHIEQRIETQSYLTTAEFISAFEDAQCRPVTLAPPRILIKVFRLFAQTASNDQWAWFADTLVTTLRQHSGSKEILGTPTLVRAVRAVCMAKLRRWEEAKKTMALSFFNVTSFHDYNIFDLECYLAYARCLRQSDRLHDIAFVLRYSGPGIQRFLTGPRLTLKARAAAVSLNEAIKQDLRRVPDPVEWIKQQFAADGHQTDVVRVAAAFVLSFARDGHEELSIALDIHNLITARTSVYPQNPASTLAVELASTGDHFHAQQVFDHLRQANPELSHSSLSCGLIVYASAGKPDEAASVWRSIVSRYTPTKMDKIQYVISMGEGMQQTIDRLRELFDPSVDLGVDVDILHCLFRVAIQIKATGYAERYFELLSRHRQSIRLYEQMLGLYSSTSDLQNAVILFDRLLSSGVDPTRQCYVALISAFASRGDAASAQAVFDAMCDQGIEANEVAWSALFNANIEAGDYVSVTQLSKDIPPHMLNHPSLMTVVLKAFVHIGAPIATVMPIFRMLDKPHPTAWALITQSAADNGDLALAKQLFEELDATAVRDPSQSGPNVYVFSILLAAYLRAGDADSGRAVYDEMIRRRILPSSVTYGIIIRSYASSPDGSAFDQAHKFAMSILDIIEDNTALSASGLDKDRLKEDILGPLLVASGRAGDVNLAEEYFNVEGYDKPSIPWLARMMDAYRRGGDVDAVMRTWKRIFTLACETTHMSQPSMPSVYKIAPFTRSKNNTLCISLSIVIKALAETDKYEEIRDVWRQVRAAGFAFDSQNYNHLAVALAQLGDIEGAFHIVDRILLPRFDQIRDRLSAAVRPESTLGSIPSRLRDEEDGNQADDGDEYIDMYEDESAAEHETTTVNRRKELLDATRPHPRLARELDLNLLGIWRPSDILWRPNFATISMLNEGFSELERARATAMIGVAYDEESDAEDVDGVVRLQEGDEAEEGVVKVFGHPVKDQEGNVKKTTPQALFWRLQRKYKRVVSLCLLHRRKQADRAKRARTERR